MTPQRRKKAGDRFRQINLVIDEVIRNLTAPQGLVLCIAWRHADPSGQFAVSTTDLAECAGISRRRMRTVLDQLVEKGALKLVKKAYGTRPARYRITGQPRAARGDQNIPSKAAS